ncbi:MAG TPA: hypothetical protein VFR31_04350, partial [Thermoanaerobaculia bacterium]|nr:hypothetical protein [Thermoanaerobaculia bacterium]
LALSLIASFVLALVLGATVLARDLAERRMGFYFSRPLPGWAIWGGKLAAAVLLAFGAGLLILLPAVLLGDRPDPSGFLWQGADDLGLWAGSILAVLLLANAASVAVRSRSAWLLLDLLAAAVLAAAVWLVTRRLLEARAFEAMNAAHLGLLAGAVLSLAAASAFQVVLARTDLRRGHRVLSLVLWSLLGLSVLAFGGFTAWVLGAEPEDLAEIDQVLPAPSGDWIALSGAAEGRAGYEPAFLLDTRSGRFVRISPIEGLWYGLAFSRDGRRAAWVEARGRSQFYLASLDLGRPGSAPVLMPGPLERFPLALALSPDGARLALLDSDRVLVQELRTGKLLASIPIPRREALRSDRIRFLDGRRLRFFGADWTGAGRDLDSRVRVIDFEAGSGRVLSDIQVPGGAQILWGFGVDSDRILLRSTLMSGGRFEMRVADLRTAEPPVTIPLAGTFAGSVLLRDGRMVFVSDHRDRSWLQILDARGTELKRIPIDSDLIHLGGQPEPGLLVLAVRKPGLPRKWRSLLLDVDRGTLRPLGEGLHPAGWPSLPEGSVGTRLFIQDKGGLVQLDTRTGRRKVILRS